MQEKKSGRRKFGLTFTYSTEPRLIAWLEKQENKNDYIRQLIEADMRLKGVKTDEREEKTNTLNYQLSVRLNLESDKDVMERLAVVKNKADYIRQLILADINGEERVVKVPLKRKRARKKDFLTRQTIYFVEGAEVDDVVVAKLAEVDNKTEYMRALVRKNISEWIF